MHHNDWKMQDLTQAKSHKRAQKWVLSFPQAKSLLVPSKLTLKAMWKLKKNELKTKKDKASKKKDSTSCVRTNSFLTIGVQVKWAQES